MARKPAARLHRFVRRVQRPCFHSGSARAGFALVAVIWSLGLITLLGTAVIVGARYRTKVASSFASETAAAAAAEGAINLGIATILNASPDQNINFPLRCRMPNGAHVAVTVEPEAGKVDMNTARPEILAGLFRALAGDPSIGNRIAARIVAFRDPGGDSAKNAATRASADPSGSARKAGFTTIMQLDQINGVSPRLFRAALRLITVRSGRPEPLAEAASPVLRQVLNLDQKPAAPMHGPLSGSVTFRADVRAADGSRFIREALVSFAENSRPFVIREWRHGDIDPKSPSVIAPDGTMSENGCFRFGEAIGS